MTYFSKGLKADIADQLEAGFSIEAVTITGGDSTAESGSNSAGYSVGITDDSPVAYWRLGELSGTTAADEIGSNDGTYVGTYTLSQTGLLTNDSNTCVDFDTGAEVDLGSTVSYCPTNSAWSIELWYHTDGNLSTSPIIVSLRTGSGRPFAIGLSDNVSYEDLFFGANSGFGQFRIENADFVNTETTNHLIITYGGVSPTSASSFNVYLNGALQSGIVSGGSFGAVSDESNIGSYAGTQGFDGRIDEVAVYDTVLTVAQVQNHYFKGLAEQYAALITSDGPTSYWRLGESTGSPLQTTAEDSAGANDGTYVNTPTLGFDGAIDGGDTAVDFNGSTQRVTVSHDSSLTVDLSDGFSIELWVRNASNNDQNATFVAKRETSGNLEQYAFGITGNDSQFVGVGKNVAMLLRADGTNERGAYVAGGSLGDTRWHHVVGVYDNSLDEIKIYVDGSEESVTADHTSGSSGFTIDNTNQLTIANDNGSNYFDGELDEIAIYHRTLSAAEILEHYNARLSAYAALIQGDSPWLYWRVNESTGTTARDTSGNERDGTYNNSPTLAQDGAIDGDANRSVGMVATSYIYGDHDFGTPGDFSVEAWVNFDSIQSTTDWISLLGTANSGLTNGGLHLGTSGENPGQFNFSIWDGGTWQVAGPASLTLQTGVWYHVVGTKSTTNGMKLYVNGAEVATNAFTGSPLSANTTEIVAGRHESFDTTVDGRLDELALYTSELSADEVLEHYQIGIGVGSIGSYESLVLNDVPTEYWRLGETSGVTANNEISSNDGTYNNAPTLGATGLLASDNNTAVTFNGSDEYVSLPTGAIITGTNERTVEVWAHRATTASGEEVIYFSGTQSSGQAFLISYDASGVRFNSWAGGSFDNSVSLDYAGKNVHLVFVYDGTKQIAYINGEKVVDNTVTLNTGSSLHVLGQRGDSANYFSGTIDEVAIYDRVLTPTEIAQHYQIGNSGPTTSGDADFDFEGSNFFTYNVPNAPVTLSNPTNKAPGVWYIYAIAGSGGRSSLSFDTDYNVVSGSFDGTANTVNILRLVSDGSEIDVSIYQRP